MRILYGALVGAICAAQAGLASAAQLYNCENTAQEVLFLSQEQRSPFGAYVIGLVEQKKLFEEEGRVVCQALALFSDSTRGEMRYAAYVEYDQWWIQYEAKSAAGYDDILLLEHERADRTAQAELLPQRIADFLEELDVFPADHFGPGTPALTIELKLSELGFLEAVNRVTDRGTIVPLSLMDDRERAVMLFYAASFTAPLWEQAAPVALSWTFTATPSRTPGAPPTITWPGGGTEVAEAPAAPSPAAPPATPPASGAATDDTAEVVAAPPPAKPGKTKAPQLVCAYSIERISNGGRQMIGRGQLALRNGTLTPVNAEWLTDGKDAENAFSGFSLAVAADGRISGSIPVYFLFPEPGRPLNEPVVAHIELPSDNGSMAHNGEVEFPLDHVFTGVFTLAGCVEMPR